MNKPKKAPTIDMSPFGELFFYINDCFDSRNFSQGKSIFEVDGIIYDVDILEKFTGDIDVETNSSNLASIIARILDILKNKGKVSFKFGSTDAHKVYVVIDARQDLDLVRQSFAHLAGQTLRKN